MKKLILIALAGFLTIVSAAPVRALGPLDFNAELPVYSKYIWRGMNNTDDWVLQPSLGVGFLGFTASIWGNTNLTDVSGNIGQMNEWDYALAYGLGLPSSNSTRESFITTTPDPKETTPRKFFSPPRPT